jgi:hypothetical protein
MQATAHGGKVKKRIDWKSIIINDLRQELSLYKQQGYKPTLRAIYYRLYSRGLFPNTPSCYNSLDRATVEARWDGRLPINCFADNARQVIDDFNEKYETIDEYLQRPIDFIINAPQGYVNSIPRWHNQPNYVEVWIEKDAMAGTLSSILRGKDVRILPNRGFTSLTFLDESANRIKNFMKLGKQIHILYFGDFDPSGDYMDVDLKKRLTRLGLPSYSIDFKRIAVTTEQIRQYGLPYNPDKTTREKIEHDTRKEKFLAKYGELYAVELDALPALIPQDFKNMVIQSVDQFFHEDIHQDILSRYSSRDIARFVKNRVKQLEEQIDRYDSYN